MNFSLGSSSSSSDDEILYDMDEEATLLFQCGYVTCNSRDSSTHMGWKGGHVICGPYCRCLGCVS
jgi:hypothetical protein